MCQMLSLKRRFCLLLCCLLGVANVGLAATTDLSDTPLANATGSVTVKPNTMFILDASGSMMQQYTPDTVSYRWGTPDASDRHCRLTSDGRYRSAADNRDLCLVGDPPFMSPDFNRQYYNPEVYYAPPVDYDGGDRSTQFMSGTAANTTNWTSVRTDGFNVQNLNQFENSATTVNLTMQYPERVFCDAQSATATDTAHCKRNTSGYDYPSIGYTYGCTTSGCSRNSPPYTNPPKYVYGGPYYFKIAAGEYCTADDLKTCVKVNLGDTPPTGYPYPAKVRWCNTAANADSTAASPAGTCQGKKTLAYPYVRFSSQTAGSVAYATVKIGGSGSTDAVTIRQVSITDPATSVSTNLITAGISGVAASGSSNVYDAGSGDWRVRAASGTSTTTTIKDTATVLARAITATWAWPARPYKACTKNTAPTCTSFGVGLINLDDTVVIYATDAAGLPVADASKAGFTVSVTTPSNNVSRASGTVTVSSSGTGAGNISSITVGPAAGPFVEVLNGGLSNFGSNSSSNRTNAATAISNRIGSYVNTNPWEYTARTNTSCGGQSAAANRVCIDAPLVNGGSPNTYIINVTASGSAAVTTTAFSGGVSRSIPVTISAFVGGVAAQATFTRVNIVSGQTYPRTDGRSDCIASPGVCTYDEEMTNFANWYTYYRTRMQAMKTGASHAFVGLTSDYRLGFSTIQTTSFPSAAGSSYVPINDLISTQKQTWYNTLFSQTLTSGTPLRTALARVGEMFAGNATYDPVQYSCQQNYAILTTDGYWNSDSNSDSLLSPIGNQDNTVSTSATSPNYCTRGTGCYDGGLSGADYTLSDVALYYYSRDLRPAVTGNLWPANVPTSSNDPNPEQHMTTFTLGLGVDGTMSYRPDYETATCGGAVGPNGETSCDLTKIRNGDLTCDWTAVGATCNWPVPVADTETAVDDLWHAAVNGHGKYFSARSPDMLTAGLKEALNTMQARGGAAAAAATSNAIVAPGDNDIFQATFTSLFWDGEVAAKKIDTTTGTVLSTVSWTAGNQLDNKTADSSDTRTIYTLDTSTSPPALKTVTWDSLTSAEQAWFATKCTGTSVLSQCPTLDSTQKASAESGVQMLNYLRGQQVLEAPYDGLGNTIYRNRRHALGDISNAKPAYVRDPRRAYLDTGYATFKTNNASRMPMVYIAANDGMLHALKANSDSDAGSELWAYMPRQIMPNLWKLADNAYGAHHQYYVDGSPEVADVYIGGAWKTILVGGLNKGGRGFYALDITNPSAPAALWEVCSDSSLCTVSDEDLGYSYGNPVIAKLPSDGRWVVMVTSGYNNVSPGDGKGYLYILDAANGSILQKIATDTGSTTTPSGFSKITAWAENGLADNTALRIYGGDYLGNLWRINLATGAVVKLAQLTDNLNVAQPVTSTPEIGRCTSMHDMVYVGTGSYLGTSDLSNTQRQTIYGIKDGGAALGAVRSNNMLQRTLGAVSGLSNVYTITNANVVLDLDAKNGWFMDLDRNLGERINLGPQLVRGTLDVFTNQPTNISACTTGGVSYKYDISACDGTYIQSAAKNRVGEKFSDAIVVGFIIVKLPSGVLKSIGTLASGEQKTEPVLTTGISSSRRVSWRDLSQ